jgi:lipopolysaccharide biosynthesis regulator YciM
VGAKRNYQREIANYHCELATTERVHGRNEDAHAQLALAPGSQPQVRAREPADAASGSRTTGRHAEALEAWKAIESQDPHTWASPPTAMVESYKALGRLGEGSRSCAACSTAIRASTCSTSSTRRAPSTRATKHAWRLVRDEVRRNPTLVGPRPHDRRGAGARAPPSGARTCSS